MIQYHISYLNPASHILNVGIKLKQDPKSPLTLQLPAWRPGRYELSDYANNITDFTVISGHGFHKSGRNTWVIEPGPVEEIEISYSYLAHKMDAGSSWLDPEQLYINFINLAMYVVGQEDVPYTVLLDIPKHYQVNCALPYEHNTLKASSFYELVDSPVFAAETIHTKTYQVDENTFELAVVGDYVPTEDQIEDFRKFTVSQMKLFSGFPSQHFTFMIQALPYRHYHGVEHKNSTVITIGPDKTLTQRPRFKELLGVSSHELFHCWNVTRIRPKEMVPYDFSKENYYETGYITEGITTYYGDLFLVRSGVFSEEEYLSEVRALLQRHLDNPGRYVMSLTASSYDLWIDGYHPAPQHRNVSIYTKGALAALILDLMIIKRSNGKHSLDDVMKAMWERFGDGKTGYSKQDYAEIVSKYIENPALYFETYIEGTTPLEGTLKDLLHDFGYTLNYSPNSNPLARHFGFRTIEQNGRDIVQKVLPGSPAFGILEYGDVLQHCVLLEHSANISFVRKGQLSDVKLLIGENSFFDEVNIVANDVSSEEVQMRKKVWLSRE